MDLQARKLHFIEEILMVNNEKVFDELESVLVRERQNLEPVLKEKLTSRALKAEDDIKAGRVMDRKTLEERLNRKLGL